MSNVLKNKNFIVGLLLLLTLFMVISPLKIVQAEREKELRYGGWLTDCVYSDAGTLNPILSYDSTSSYIESFIFESLLTYDKDKQFVPELALSWDISSNKHIYTMYLREDVYWHDNVKFTADDVIFTWERVLDPRTQTTRAGWFDLWNDLNPFEKVDDYTIKFHLKYAYAGTLNEFAMKIIPKHIFESYCPPEGSNKPYKFNDCLPNSHPVGTGSIMFDEWIPDNQTVLIRNSRANGGPGYWREHDAYLDGVKIKIIPEVTTQLIALRNGEIDKMDLSSAERSEIEQLEEDKRFNIYKAPIYAYDYITFNCDPSKGHHADSRDFNEEPNYFAGFEWMEYDAMKLPGPNIRKALNYAINKDYLIEVAYPFSYRNIGPMYIAQTYWYNESVDFYDFDLDKAHQLLANAGFGTNSADPLRKKLKFTISYNIGNIRRESTCNYVKSQWESLLGIEVTVEAVEWVSMLNSHYDHRKFDAISAGWNGGGGDPDLTNVWHSKNIMTGGQPSSFNPDTFVWEWEGEPKPYGLNYMGYWNPEVDNLLEIARSEQERVVRKVYYNQIQEMIVDDCPYIWGFSHVNLQIVCSNIHGMVNDSVAGFWPQPIGFHNIWKEVISTTSDIITTDQQLNESSEELFDYSFYMLYLLPLVIIGGFFVIGSILGLNLRKR